MRDKVRVEMLNLILPVATEIISERSERMQLRYEMDRLEKQQEELQSSINAVKRIPFLTNVLGADLTHLYNEEDALGRLNNAMKELQKEENEKGRRYRELKIRLETQKEFLLNSCQYFVKILQNDHGKPFIRTEDVKDNMAKEYVFIWWTMLYIPHTIDITCETLFVNPEDLVRILDKIGISGEKVIAKMSRKCPLGEFESIFDPSN